MPPSPTAAPRPRDGAALACLVAGALAIALGPILVRLSDLHPVATAFYRLIIALPFFWAGLHAERRAGAPPVTGREVALMVLAGAMLAGDLALWHLSITMTSVANATLFNNCAPVFVALFGWLLFRERVSGGLVAALAVALAGMGLLIGGNAVQDGAAGAAGDWRGDALAISTGAFYAVYLMVLTRLRQSLSTTRIMAGTTAAAAVLLLGAAAVEGGPLVPAGLHGWGVVLALGIVCHVVGQSLITSALAHLPVTFSSIGLLVQPVGAAALAWLLLGEALGAVQWLGGGLALAGITLARRATAGSRGAGQKDVAEGHASR
ncbi:drug/metabolite transporter (DMT)-like permease [Azospirillum fermentarium]|uniref:DMT family transporter n=1 Tax=Azospirillum fermentarium TaxID=1233114 RepID=UPI002226725A|nr:DMT family transporter [Azospirillum fermentarium]MCW2248902.1 drug/metabolite transporter (DMT)-like permease [Azospirillum fermentarium]